MASGHDKFQFTVDGALRGTRDKILDGSQIREIAGLAPASEFVLIQIIGGIARSISIEEEVRFESGEIGVFLSFRSDRTYSFMVNERGWEWGTATILAADIYRYAAIDAEMELILDSAQDAVIPADGEVRLDGAGVESIRSREPKMVTSKRMKGVGLDALRHAGYSVKALAKSTVISVQDAAAFAVAIGLRMEIPIECIKELRRDCLKNSAGGRVTVEYYKGRGNPPKIKSERVTDGGINTPGGIIRLALSLSEPVAQALTESGSSDAPYLFVGFAPTCLPSWRLLSLSPNNLNRAVASWSVLGDDGKPLGYFQSARMRKTVKSQRYARVLGHLESFASDHSRPVAGFHYSRLKATDEQHKQSLEAAMGEMLADAMLQPKIVGVDDEERARAKGYFHDLPVHELLDGPSDTFLGTCLNFWASPTDRAPDGSCRSAFSSWRRAGPGRPGDRNASLPWEGPRARD